LTLLDNYLLDFDLEKREREIQRGLNLFSKYKTGLNYLNDAALKITGVYASILSQKIKDLIPKRISKFKMGAITALTVVKLQPIQIGNGDAEKKLERELNAELAFFLAMNLILDMNNPNGYELGSGIETLDESAIAIKSQHISYLKLKELNDFPVFPIASFYYCFFLLNVKKFMAFP